MDPQTTDLLAVAFVTLAIGVYFSLLKVALVEYSRGRLEEMVGSSAWPRYVARLEREDDLLLAARAMDRLALLAFTIAVTVWAWLRFDGGGEPWRAIGVAAGACAAGILVVAEALPRAIGENWPERVLCSLFGPFYAAYWLTRPLTGVLRLLGDAVPSRSPGKASDAKEELAEDVLDVVEEGAREGVLDESDRSMIEHVIEFRDAAVSEVMTPRTDVVAVDADATLEQVIEAVMERGPSRVPVFEGVLDRIVGALHVKDILRYWSAEDRSRLRARDLMRPPTFVPETKHVGDLLKEFQAKKVHIAIVLDEYGGTAGIVTLEDIIEEIVGEIEDEHDPARRVPLRRLDEQTVDVDARLKIEEVNEALGIDLPEDDAFETVGGFVFGGLGKVPIVGERFIHRNVEFTVTEADERKINRLRIGVVP